MSEVVIVEMLSVYDNDSQLSVHEDYDDANNLAASKMYWWFDQFGFNDPSNIEDHEIYTEVHDLITAGNIQAALDIFNDIDDIKCTDYSSEEFIRIFVARYEVKAPRTTWSYPQKKIIQSETQPVVNTKQEFACPICKRNNYVGEATCWNCGNSI